VARSDVYDTATDTWTPIADMPTRLTHAGTAVVGHDVYFAGGYVESATKEAKSAAAKAQVQLDAASIYDSVSNKKEAEKMLRDIAQSDVHDHVPLISWLLKEDRATEAFSECLEAVKSDDSPRSSIMFMNILVSGKLGKAELATAEPIINKTLEKHENNSDLLFLVATFRQLQERPDEAYRLYRAVLRSDPSNMASLNNLAMLLSEALGH
jgi:tetratricopeptide (TPR) repeat protein